MKRIMVVASVVMMLIFSSVSVMAADSPTADDYYTITMGSSSSATSADVDGGTITVSENPIVAGEEVTLTASAEDGYAFVEWVIDGDYEIVEGSLEDEVLVIIPAGDIDVDATFESEDGDTTTTTTSDDTSSTSPQTGDSVATAAVMLVLACGIAAVSKRKITE